MPFLLSVFFIVYSFTLVSCSSRKNDNPSYERINQEFKKKKKAYVPSDLRPIKDIPQFPERKYYISPGFLFSMYHPTDEKLRGQFRVYFDGLLRLPYNIRVNVTGQTYAEVKKQVMDSYNAFFQRGGQDIDFRLIKKEYWVEVRGFVKKSGYYLVKRKDSIDKIIDKAGGLSGNLKRDIFIVSIKQQDQSYSVSLNQYYENNVLKKSFTWTGGDTVFINLLNEDPYSQTVPTVSVIGGVLTPGKTLYREGASLFYYLGKAGGVIPNLGYEDCFVIRKTASGVERIKFDITDMATVPSIKSGDVIMLNAERKTYWDRIFDRTTQVGALLATIALVILAL